MMRVCRCTYSALILSGLRSSSLEFDSVNNRFKLDQSVTNAPSANQHEKHRKPCVRAAKETDSISIVLCPQRPC
eukprot:5102006-Amphidinium_carterae.1